MAFRYLLLSLCSVICGGTTLCGQLVTLQGRTFMVGGQEYYPIVMNFAMSSIINGIPDHDNPPASPGTDVYVTPDSHYGPTAQFDCFGASSCDQDIDDYFFQVKAMGFNAIRIVGVAPFFRHRPELGPASDPANRVFSLLLHGNNGGPESGRDYIDLVGPDFTDVQSQAHFQRILHVLDRAEAADLKVILLCVERTNAGSTPGAIGMYPTYDQEASTAYAEYLAALSYHLQGHPALLAYDLFNEPSWAGLDIVGGSNNLKWLKADVCGFVEEWFDAIQVNDADHLVTLGGVGYGEANIWDISALKLDFYSLHIYPEPDYDWEYNHASWDFDEMLLRMQGQLHWMSQVCPMPWIIGETGFAASDRTGPWPHVDNNPAHHQFPYMHGTENEQAAFAQASLDLARQCGASGWSWWAFQEVAWWGLNDINYTNIFPHSMQQLYYGLMHLGDGGPTWSEKPAVSVVENWVAPTMPMQPGNEPSNYTNPFNLSGPVVHSGMVLDGLGAPVPHAVVGIQWDQDDDPDVLPNLYNLSNPFVTWQRTFTDASGHFEFRAQPQVMGFDAPVLGNAGVTAIGYPSESRGYWNSTPIVDGEVFEWDQIVFELDNEISGLQVSTISGIDHLAYQAWDHLEVWDTELLGGPHPGETTIDFVARSSVHLNPDFHAHAGSVVHVFTDQTFPSCSDNSYRTTPGSGIGVQSVVEEVRRSPKWHIDLQFQFSDGPILQVRPNPCSVELVVIIAETEGDLQLADLRGRVLRQWHHVKGQLRFDVTSLADGPYSLTYANGVARHTSLVIKQTTP